MYVAYWERSSKYCPNTEITFELLRLKNQDVIPFQDPCRTSRKPFSLISSIYVDCIFRFSFFKSCRGRFSWGKTAHFLSRQSVGTRVQRESRVRGTSTKLTIKDQLCKRLYWCLYLMIFFLYFIFKQQFQALHKKIWTTTACALLNITYQIQPMTTYPITRF